MAHENGDANESQDPAIAAAASRQVSMHGCEFEHSTAALSACRSMSINNNHKEAEPRH